MLTKFQYKGYNEIYPRSKLIGAWSWSLTSMWYKG